MLQLTSTLQNHPFESIKLECGHALAPLVIGKDHGQFLIESALHSYIERPNTGGTDCSALTSYGMINTRDHERRMKMFQDFFFGRAVHIRSSSF